MEALAGLIRFVHFVGASLLLGVFVFLVGVARPAVRAAAAEVRDRFGEIDARLMRLGLCLLGITLASGVLDLWRQVVVATGREPQASLAPEAFASVLLETRYGSVWLVRHALLVLLGALLLLRERDHERADWTALRLEGLALAAASLGLIGAAGHAASAPVPAAAILVDALHLLATGAWFGGLVPLALLLHWALALPAARGLGAAAVAARRFSALGLGSVALLVATGGYNLWVQVGSVAALVGTPYGRWLSLKLALLLPLLAVAALNRFVVKPRLVAASGAGDRAAAVAAVQRLRQQIFAEVALGCAILAVVAVLGLTTPARHAPPSWPFTVRLSWEATKGLPGVRTRVAVGSQLALLGLIAALLAVLVGRRGWRWIAGAGGAAIALGLAVALPPLAVDAYPTTYLRPAVPYTAASVANGLALYRAHCAACHGVAGYGDGPAAAGLRPRPADLTAKHTADHTVGDLYWWLSHGIRGSQMPGFAERLTTEERWDLINFLRTLAAAEQARRLGPVAAADGPVVVAPDFEFTTGVGEGRTLADYRGNVVLLVFFSLPESVERLIRLGTVYPSLRLLGAEILAVPLRAGGDIYRALGPRPIFFPIAVDGAAEMVTTYALFRRDLSPAGQRADPAMPPHMELLVDRPGYLRARWIPAHGGGWADPSRLVAEVERLATETPRAPPPTEHVH